MQNRYAGDVGDFGKFGMLRAVATTGLRIGVNWYLVPDENHNDDGKHIGYLSNKDFLGCDDELLNKLRAIVVEKRRSTDSLEHALLLPNACYYNEVLYPPKAHEKAIREEWHECGLKAMSSSDIVFLDPDNGLLVKSVTAGSCASIKYVFRDELADYYAQGHSMIFYNHRSRLQEKIYLERFTELEHSSAFKGSEWLDLKFVRGTIRDYFFILQPEHAAAVRNAAERLLIGGFGQHFSLIEF
jgi:hypothetical protein